jgi:phosphoribosylformylglycinamidine cyclo-ligase
LARHILFDLAGMSLNDPAWDEPGAPTLADELLRPSVIYSPAVRSVIAANEVHCVAHITGGGLAGNLSRVLNAETDAVVDRSSWEWPRIFSELARLGSVERAEMEKVFNLGIGMVLVVPEAEAASAISCLASEGHQGRVIGDVVMR